MRSSPHYDRRRRTRVTHGKNRPMMLLLLLVAITAALYLFYTLIWLSSPQNHSDKDTGHDVQEIERTVQGELQQMVRLLQRKLTENRNWEWKPPVVAHQQHQNQRLQESDRPDRRHRHDHHHHHHDDKSDKNDDNNNEVNSKQLTPEPVHVIPEDERLFREAREPIVPWEQYHPVYKDILHTIAPGGSRDGGVHHHPANLIVSVITSDRHKDLRLTLRSLSQVLFWNPNNTVVFQHGNHSSINKVVDEFGLKHVQNQKMSGRHAKSAHIAHHYHFVLKKTFEMFPNAPYFIVIEDDMLLAPDLLLYFAQLAPLMMRDPSIFAISAYGDNGFHGMAVNDNMVYRSDFFIGLGWLVKRQWFETEWSKRWPKKDWDHHFRQRHVLRSRQILYPEVPRVYHFGYRGSHVSTASHERYFRHIRLNLNGFAPLGVAALPLQEKQHKYHTLDVSRFEEHSLDYLSPPKNYEKFMDSLFDPNNPKTVYLESLSDVTNYKDKNLILFYEKRATTAHNLDWDVISTYFKIWHTIPLRDNYKGTIMIGYAGNMLLLVPSKSPYHIKFGKHGIVMRVDEFKRKPEWRPPHSESVVRKITTRPGESCNNACIRRFGPTALCNLGTILEYNSIPIKLQLFFESSEPCKRSEGADRPGIHAQSNQCLYNHARRHEMATSCTAHHSDMKRFCACLSPLWLSAYYKEWKEMLHESSQQSTHPNGISD